MVKQRQELRDKKKKKKLKRQMKKLNQLSSKY